MCQTGKFPSFVPSLLRSSVPPSLPPFLHFSLPPLPFFSPKHRILRKYHEQQRRDKIAVNPLKCLFTSCLTFDGSRNITDTKRIITLGPWGTESQHWKSLQGKHQVAVSSCFKLCKRGTICENPLPVILKCSTNVEHSSYLLNQERLLRGS